MLFFLSIFTSDYLARISLKMQLFQCQVKRTSFILRFGFEMSHATVQKSNYSDKSSYYFYCPLHIA